MKTFSKLKEVLLGVGALTGVGVFYYINNPKKVYASWTTNFEPSFKWDDNWDHRSPKSLVNPKKMHAGDNEDKKRTRVKSTAMRHIILIRHGQYNLDGKTDEDRILTELGRIQANYTGKRLKELGLPYTEMVKSTMARAHETGSIISTFLPELSVELCDLIREGAPIEPEPPVDYWQKEKHQFFTDGARIEAGFRRYFYRADPKQKTDSYTLLVCHGNVIRYFVCRALQFPPEGWLRISLNHASITWIAIAPNGRVSLRCLGDCGHMPPEVITNQ